MIRRSGVIIFLAATIGVAAWRLTETQVKAQNSNPPTPVLVELFTSEGCSSCPPADALLVKLDHLQPVAGAELIVLSEHVDYWNYIGWTDPYSARFYSDRQNSYARRFGLPSVYTPQMVVDGSSEFVGSDAGAADQAIVQALKTPKIGVRLSGISLEGTKNLTAHVETEVLPPSYGQNQRDVYLAVALSHAETNVPSGENSGRKLAHAGVVLELMKIGALQPGQSFTRDIRVKLAAAADPRNLRVVAFIQESGAGRVIGATTQSLSK